MRASLHELTSGSECALTELDAAVSSRGGPRGTTLIRAALCASSFLSACDNHDLASTVNSDIRSIESALVNYAINNSGRYPDTLEPLVTPDVNGATYLRVKVLPKDAWDRDYLYDPPVPGNPTPKIYSLGRDGRAGGTGEDADVDNISIREGEPR